MSTDTTPRPFDLKQWLGNDTWGYTKKPRSWKIVTKQNTPVISYLKDCSPYSVRMNHGRMTGYDFLDQIQKSAWVLASAELFQSLSLAQTKNDKFFDETCIPEKWKTAHNGRPMKLMFLGTILENCGGQQAVLYLTNHRWADGGQGTWKWGIKYLHDYWYPDYFALTH